jgi:catechol 2,3-dioxygenase-like lactoylglutathione lyase family enzyme
MLAESPISAFVPTIDYARARPFFEDVLQLPFVSEDPFAMVFRLHGAMLRVVKVDGHAPARFTILGWRVDDIAAEARRLADRGVVFVRYPFFQQDDLGIWTAPSGDKVAWFRDPDGNVLSIAQHVRRDATD